MKTMNFTRCSGGGAISVTRIFLLIFAFVAFCGIAGAVITITWNEPGTDGQYYNQNFTLNVTTNVNTNCTYNISTTTPGTYITFGTDNSTLHEQLIDVDSLTDNTMYYAHVNCTNSSDAADWNYANRTFYKDYTEPSVVDMNTNDSDNIVRSSDSLNITVNVTDSSGVATVTVNGTSMTQSGDIWYTVNTTADFGCTTDGPCVLSFVATDNAGNINSTETLTITVDNTAPKFTRISPENDSYTSQGMVILHFNVTDVLSGVNQSTINVTAGNGTILFNSTTNCSGTASEYACNAQWNTTGLDGTYIINVTAKDNVLNQNTTELWTLHVTTTPSCGATITSITLSQDMNCSNYTGNALNMGANDVVLDCQGHTIMGSYSYYGINVTGYNNIVIRNCTISSGHAIFIKNSASNEIMYNTLINNSAVDSGIHLENVSDSIISYNNLNQNYIGIFLSNCNNLTIDNNTIKDNNVSGINATNSNATIINNEICYNDKGINSDTESNLVIVNNTFCVDLKSPADGWHNPKSSWNFTFFVSNILNTTSCSLYIDSSLDDTNSSVNDNVNTTLNSGTLAEGTHSWYIRCNDSGNNTGLSLTWQLNIKKSNGVACSADIECQSGYCVHGVCRPSRPYCGDGYCDSGETYNTCPSDCPSPPPHGGGGGGGGGGPGYGAKPKPSCFDGIQNCHDGACEEGIDCGGPCKPCPSCFDGIQNQGEEGIDCGGPCPPCVVMTTTTTIVAITTTTTSTSTTITIAPLEMELILPDSIHEGEDFTAIVVDRDGNPLEGVEVNYAGITRITDSDGKVVFTGIKGEEMLSASKSGYKTTENQLTIIEKEKPERPGAVLSYWLVLLGIIIVGIVYYAYTRKKIKKKSRKEELKEKIKKEKKKIKREIERKRKKIKKKSRKEKEAKIETERGLIAKIKKRRPKKKKKVKKVKSDEEKVKKAVEGKKKNN